MYPNPKDGKMLLPALFTYRMMYDVYLKNTANPFSHNYMKKRFKLIFGNLKK